MFKRYFFNKSKKTQQLNAVIVVVIVAGIGTLLLLGSHAASPYFAVTADQGTLGGVATKQTCSQASDGSCVIFGSSSGTGGSQHTNCLQLQSGSRIYPVYAGLDACGYPSPNTAGVPAGTNLTTVSNTTANYYAPNTQWNGTELGITGPTTINDLNIPGDIYVVISDFSNPANADITIENSHIEWASATASPPQNFINLQGAGNVTIKYSQVSGYYSNATTCANPVAYDVSGGGNNLILDHDYLSCSGEPVSGSGITLTNSYVIVDGYPAGEHLEDYYIPGGATADIENNTLLQPNNQTAGLFGDAKQGAMNGLTIKNNLIGTGGNNGNVAIGCYATEAQNGYAAGANNGYGYSTNVIVEDNRMSNAYYSVIGAQFAAGNTDGGSGTIWSNNYMDNNPSDIVAQPVAEC